jgi:hypothetical protein
MIGTFPRLVRGYEGLIPPHIFKLLVLAAESFMQINDVNSVIVPWQKIIMRVNELCSIASEGKPKTSIFDRVMRSTTSLSMPLLRLKSRRDAFAGQRMQIF